MEKILLTLGVDCFTLPLYDYDFQLHIFVSKCGWWIWSNVWRISHEVGEKIKERPNSGGRL